MKITVTCECGAVYERSVMNLPVRYEGEIRCQFCGSEIETCSTSHMSVYELVSEPLQTERPPSVPVANNEAATKKGYVIANISVTDPERYERYKVAAPAVIAKFGGRYLVKAPKIESIEGSLSLDRFVILEFDSLAQAREFYYSADYQEVAKDRMAASRSDFLLMEGWSDPAAARR